MTQSSTRAFDAVVVGTGAGGACVAYQLARAGLKTLAVEKGPLREVEDLLEGGVFGPAFMSQGRGDELKFIGRQYLMPSDRRRFLRYSEHGQLGDAILKPTENGWMSQMVGGGTVHYGGASFRFSPMDFRMRSTFGHARVPDLDNVHQADLMDWPLHYEDFVPWYEEAERLIGIAGAPGSDLPALRFNKAAILIARALSSAGSPIEVTPTPMAINSRDHGGRAPCQNSGLCQDFGCRFEAKSDMRVTLLRDALLTGNLTIQPLTFVRRLEIEGGRAKRLECVVDGSSGRAEIAIEAPIVIIACETIETIRLLLASGLTKPGVLGHYLMFHVTGGARSIAPVRTTTWDTAPHTAQIWSLYEHSSTEPPFLKTGILLPTSSGGPLQEGGRYWGERARMFYSEVYPFKMDLSYVGEGLPTQHNAIALSSEVDSYGMPRTSINYRPHPFDLNAGRYVAERCKEILTLAGGLTEDTAPARLKPFLRKETTAGRLFHCTGGCRFGEDPATSVLDPSCRVHELENVYIADGAFMPTGGGANPTLTIQANALRIGHLIASNSGGRAG